MIGTETGEACVASSRNPVAGDVARQHFGDKEYAVALARYDAADQFF
jgi:hypothetical protein